jgi:hypothetical protein
VRRDELKRLLAYTAVACGSLVAVLASAAIPETAGSRAAAANFGFGYPFHFLYGDLTLYTPRGYPETFALNPWEVPTTLRPAPFLVSWAGVALALLALARLTRFVIRRARDEQAPSPY